MGIGRKMLGPVAAIGGWHAAGQLRAFLKACRDTAGVQEALLRRLVEFHADSDFGRDHGFASIRDYRDFAAAVPLGDYSTLHPYLQRVLNGEVGAMFPAGTRINMFAVTSGTTGSPKYIPVTDRFMDDYQRGWHVFGLKALLDHRDGWLRRILTIASSAHESLSPTGLPCGAISGLLAERQKWIVRRMYPVPAAARGIRDASAKFYTILRCCIGGDMALITTANPSSLVKLAQAGIEHAESLIRDVRDGTLTPPVPLPDDLAGEFHFRPDAAAARRLESILRRHGELAPRHYWNPAVIMCWTGGTVGLYLPQVEKLYGPAPVRDIGLLASEGRLSVPLADGTPSGVAEILGNFLEFIPADQAGNAKPDVLRAHELEQGGEYFVVLTNWAGLWRYQIGDRVRVTGFEGTAPVYEFLSRGLHSSSITGEKLTENQVVLAMRQCCQELSARIELFELQGHFADPPYYQLRVELSPGMVGEKLAAAFDQNLRRLNMEYDGKRAGGRLGPVRLQTMPPGHFAAHEAAQVQLRLGRSEQYKHRYLLGDIITDG